MSKLIICFVLVFAAIIMDTNAQLRRKGGIGASKPVDEVVTGLVDRLRANIIQKICDSGSSCPSSDAQITINSYKTQTVAGTNYFVSVTIDDVVYHVRIFASIRNTEEVTSVQGPKAVADEISYFR